MSRRASGLGASVLVIAAAAIAGCGGSTKPSSSTAPSQITSTTSRTASSTTAAPTTAAPQPDAAVQTYFHQVAGICAHTLSRFRTWDATGNVPQGISPPSAASARALAAALQNAAEQLGAVHVPPGSAPGDQTSYAERLQTPRTDYSSFAKTLMSYAATYVSSDDAAFQTNPGQTQVDEGETTVASEGTAIQSTATTSANLRACDVTSPGGSG